MRRVPPAPGSTSAVHRAMTRFIIAGLGALLVVSVGGWWAARSAAEHEAVEDARQQTITLARAVVEPNLNDALLRSDPQALQDFDELIKDRVLSDNVVRVKLWTSEGRIVYSDQRELINQHYPLDEEELAALRSRSAAAEESDLARAENQFDRVRGPLLEVYLPVQTPGGVDLLFETYQTRSAVAARRAEVLEEFAPIMLGGLGVLLAAVIPMAWSLARRLEAARAERERLLHHALDASTTERRRIAAHLHDGMVQSLVGSSYALAGVADTLQEERHAWAASVVGGAASELRQNVRAVRSLLVEIYPPSLRREGLGPALSDLTAQLASREIEVVLDLPDVPDLPEEVEVVVFRVAQEAVRNIVKHADPHRVQVSLACSPAEVTLTVSDDGRGFDVDEVAAFDPADGHIGLDLLTDALHEVGGSLEVRSSPGQGTTLRAKVPRR